MLDLRIVRETVARALAEDIGPGDVTTPAVLPAGHASSGRILAKAAGVLAGVEVARECFRQVDPTVTFAGRLTDGAELQPGDEIAQLSGPTAGILAAERTALNFLQRMSGVASLTAQYVGAAQGSGAVIVDTRKTAPGLRALDKYAVTVGGGRNHRFGLYDGVLIKDNHVRAAGGVGEAVRRARSAVAHTLKVEVEVTDLAGVEEALQAGADSILLDNMDLPTIRQAVALVAGRALTEASGGVSLDRISELAATGVDLISVGRLTHSVTALDISLELD
jgi:nicotinate-nucleotide pyrophosphorylase (carboxylating)